MLSRILALYSRGKDMHKYTNHLAAEKSPYLQQHAHNPVDWYPWGKAAFEKAAKEDKPIFLSIGYSTCHWCHVMEHESFEDEQAAGLLNKTFVSIKVDREEYPAIDSVYMQVCQALTGSGGWPLNIIMTPDKKPFFAATYIPKESRFGHAGLMELIPKLGVIWAHERKKILEAADQIAESMRQRSKPLPVKSADITDIPGLAAQELKKTFDDEFGGFGTAPKFPSPHNLIFLLRYWHKTGDAQALRIVEETLRQMRRGGIYDHVGFGFHRYATDREWLVPHFEKMLYDQALLVMAYAEAWQATKHEEYADTAKEIIAYVLRDMTSPEGGFYSAEDADSEGEEGKFYVWTYGELSEILDKAELEFVEQAFNVQPDGNYQNEVTRQAVGNNILHLSSGTAVSVLKKQVLDKLYIARNKRVRPSRDTKVLADWNGLMIAAIAVAARSFDSDECLNAARKAADFVLQRMTDAQGRLYHCWKDGEPSCGGCLEDYAFMICGLLELYEACFEPAYLSAALRFNKVLDEHFKDSTGGAFFKTPDYAEALLFRPKEMYDFAVPSGNSVMISNLLRLSRITGDAELEKAANGIAMEFSEMFKQAPSAFAYAMLGLLFGEGPSYEIVIAGEAGSTQTQAFLNEFRKLYLPEKVLLLRESDESEIIRIAPYMEKLRPVDGNFAVYICRNSACERPVVSIDELKKYLATIGVLQNTDNLKQESLEERERL